MSNPIVYVDQSRVREGKRAELEEAIAELAAFVEENEPQLLSYHAYFDAEGRRMTVVHVHADAASLDLHMKVASSRFGRFGELLEMVSIDIYGEPSAAAVERLREKSRMLGGTVRLHRFHAGFTRNLPAR